ncbi:MAG: LysR substrate-binding domain-containing protein [Kiloniellales bacterium]|nr:LysR substrate-binding domain-containing protein [Kiloniellales bacterium]
MNTLDSDLLRTFLAVADAGSVTGGAGRIYRSQSATSVQIKQLEELLGEPVFRRHGRGVVLSTAGEALEPVARQVVQMLDGAMAEINQSGLEGSLRIGIPDEHGKRTLAKIIAEYSRDHPKVDLKVHCALSADFPSALRAGELDLAVHEVKEIGPGMEVLREERMHWVTSRFHNPISRDPIPVALFDRACWWRDVALKSLEASGRTHRIAYSSESVTGVAAAIEAGIAIGVLNQSQITPNLKALSKGLGLAEIPPSKLVLECGKASQSVACRAMSAAIKTAFAGAPD